MPSHDSGSQNGLSGMAALKLNLSKAFDRVEWIYLKEIMYKLGFAHEWISLLMNWISSVRFSILINGEAKGSFSPSRGIRQGDPLSPYVFLICAKGLSLLLHHANSMGHIAGVSFNHSRPTISHLLFANDNLNFLQSDERECIFFRQLLADYGKASSECINFSKSALIFSPNVHLDRQHYLQAILGIQLVQNLGSYLDSPFSFTCRKGRDWIFLKDRIWKIMQGWTGTSFLWEREILIKTIGQAIPSYVMSVFHLPKGFCHDHSFLLCFGGEQLMTIRRCTG